MSVFMKPLNEIVPPDWLDDHLESVRLPAWDRLFYEGDSPDYFYLVRTGLLGIFRSISPTKKILIQLLSGGDSAGLYELLSETSYRIHAIPIKETVAYRGSREELKKMEREHPRWVTQLLLDENQLQQEMSEKIDELISRELDARLARLLLSLANHTGRRTENGAIEISVKLTRKQISRMLGCATESVIRVLSSWEKSNWIETQKRMITLHEVEEVISLADRPTFPTGFPLVA